MTLFRNFFFQPLAEEMTNIGIRESNYTKNATSSLG